MVCYRESVQTLSDLPNCIASLSDNQTQQLEKIRSFAVNEIDRQNLLTNATKLACERKMAHLQTRLNNVRSLFIYFYLFIHLVFVLKALNFVVEIFHQLQTYRYTRRDNVKKQILTIHCKYYSQYQMKSQTKYVKHDEILGDPLLRPRTKLLGTCPLFPGFIVYARQ